MERSTGVFPVVAKRMATRMVRAAPSWESTVTVYWMSEIGAEVGCCAGRIASGRRRRAAARAWDLMCRAFGGVGGTALEESLVGARCLGNLCASAVEASGWAGLVAGSQ